MDKKSALAALAALGQDTRLEVFRLLVKAGSNGIPAGEVASRLGTMQNTMSAHLKVLDHAGLVRAERDGRIVRYVADMTGFPRPSGLPDGRLLQRFAGAVPPRHQCRDL